MKSMKSYVYLIASVLVVVALICILFITRNSANKVYALPNNPTVYYEKSYQSYLDTNGYTGGMADSAVTINLEQYTTSKGMEAEVGVDGILTGDVGRITWDFEVEKDGFYNLLVGYIALPGTNSDIQRKLYLDDEIHYSAMSQIVFKRWWTDEAIITKNKNEIRPNANEVYKKVSWFVEDYNRRSGEPLLFYLSKGKHTISFEVIKEPIEITGLEFKSAMQPDSYEDSINALRAKYPVYEDDSIICQAERMDGNTAYLEKNSSSINIQKNYSDSYLVPYHPYRILYNTIGADSWKQPGDSISWDITVPKEGLYTLTFKGRQSLKRGVTSYRRLYINGEVPYKEMNSIGFAYSSDMTNYTIMNDKEEPYLFYLKEGNNRITLENVLGSFGGVLNEVEESMYQLNQIYLKVIQITGQAPDKYIDYQIVKKVPEFTEVMGKESERLFQIVNQLVEITGEKGENTSLVEKMALEAEWLSKDPESVIEELAQLKNNISALGTWLMNISQMPLELDSIVIGAEKVELPAPKDNFVRGLYNGTIRFLSTFFINSKQISANDNTGEGQTIKVWMASAGREQAQIVQNMIDETFTPETGINVNLQLIPIDVVLRAALAGNGPDVVIGLAQGTLQDFAMRNAVVDLSKLEGFTEISSKYYKSAVDAASYQDGVYGLAEQETYMMMFCRNDILEKLGVEIPKTWDEVKEIIPVLKKSNYDFYLPSTQTAPTFTNLYTSIVYQNGGNLYKGTGKDYGIKSALDEEPAMIAFKEYTDLFTNYGLLVQVDFSNRFRTGEMPIGITNYVTYCQLEIFAPEIKGLWSFSPLPGVMGEDGTINNSYAVDTVQSVIMESSEKREASWKFLKWWTDTESQLQYANTLESVMGTAARYPAADPGVLQRLPWSNTELSQLLNQMEDTVGIPAVPGHYMTTRMIQYSFNDVVANLANPRETLYLNVKSINKELTKKRMEFNLSR